MRTSLQSVRERDRGEKLAPHTSMFWKEPDILPTNYLRFVVKSGDTKPISASCYKDKFQHQCKPAGPVTSDSTKKNFIVSLKQCKNLPKKRRQTTQTLTYLSIGHDEPPNAISIEEAGDSFFARQCRPLTVQQKPHSAILSINCATIHVSQ